MKTMLESIPKGYPRYKIIVQVTIGEMKGQGVRVFIPEMCPPFETKTKTKHRVVQSIVFFCFLHYISSPRPSIKVTSRSLWDTKTDNYASSNFQNVRQPSPCFVEFRFVPFFVLLLGLGLIWVRAVMDRRIEHDFFVSAVCSLLGFFTHIYLFGGASRSVLR
jgi:hypothetical protein